MDSGTFQQIQDLWGLGFTVSRRNADPFEIEQRLIPRGRSYQWNDRPDQDGWRPVPFSRHPGVFAPWGTGGDEPIVVGGLYLCERPEQQVIDAREEARRAASKQVTDWAKGVADFGFSGSVRVGDAVSDVGLSDGSASRHDGYTTRNKTIETTVKVPMAMLPHMGAVYAERDRLVGEVVLPDRTLKPGPVADAFYSAVDADKSAPWWPTLHAILLPIAVENVRKFLKETENVAGSTQADGPREEAGDAGQARSDHGGQEHGSAASFDGAAAGAASSD